MSPRSPSEIQAIVCGLATVDILTRPAPLRQPIEAGVLRMVERVDLATGGSVSNAGITLSKLGVPTTAIANVGADAWGGFLRDQLLAAGLDCSELIIDRERGTAVSNVLVDIDSARSFLFAPGVSEFLNVEAIIEAIQRFPQARCLLFGYYSLFSEVDRQLPELFSQAQSRGLMTALDSAGSGGTLDGLLPILPFVDLFLPSLDEARNQTGESNPSAMIDVFRKAGAKGIVGIKMGADGSLVSPQGIDRIEVRAIRPRLPLIDTTGAGDAYVAGFLAGQLRGFSVEQSARIAAAAGANCITALGATSGAKSWSETLELAERD